MQLLGHSLLRLARFGCSALDGRLHLSRARLSNALLRLGLGESCAERHFGLLEVGDHAVTLGALALQPLDGRKRIGQLSACAGQRLLALGAQLLHRALCVGVGSDETPPELEAAADLMVGGPPGVRDLLVARAG